MAATASSLTTASALLKQHYLSPDVIENVMVPAGPNFKSLIESADTSCGGANIPFPIITAGGGGVGTSMLAAYNSATPSTSSNFLLLRAYTYGLGQIGGEVLEASENPSDAFIKNLTLEVDTKRRRMHQHMAMLLYGDGTGCIGSVNNSGFATTVLTLNDASNAIHFQAGDVIQVAASGSPTTPRTGTLTVAAVALIGPNAGQVTMTTNLSTGISAIAQDDLIFMNGDCGAVIPGGSTTSIPSGRLAWAPIAGPPSSNDSFFGVNRYNNTFLYGQFVDASATGSNLGGIREALTTGVSQLAQVGAVPSVVRMNPLAWYKLSLALQSQGMYPRQPDGGAFGFSSLVLPTPHGDIKVEADPFCASYGGVTHAGPSSTTFLGSNMCFLIEESTEEIVGKGEIPHLDEIDIGNYFLRVGGGIDAYGFQFKAYYQFGQHAPGHHMAMNLPS